MLSVARRFLPGIIGLGLAVVPFVAFEVWFDYRVEREARAEVAFNAKRVTAVIDARLSQVVAALEGLVEAGVDSCKPAHVEALRMATFKTSALKEASIIGLDGHTSCTDHSLPLGTRQLLGRPQETSIPETFVEVVHLVEAQRMMLRVRRMLDNGDAIGGLVAADMLVPAGSIKRGEGPGVQARVTGRDGTLLAEINTAPIAQAQPDDLFTATADSARFGIRATMLRTRDQVLASHGDMRVNGLIFNASAGLVIFLGTMVLMQRRRQQPQEKFAAALANGEFVPYYQPILDITTGRLTGAEVLVRWRKPDGTLVMPGTFIQAMEDNGLIVALSYHLMRQSCADLAEVYGRHPKLRVSFNLTAEQFEDEATVAEVRSIFQRSPIKLSQIVLELTERQEPSNFHKTRQVIASLQVLGCKVALDDVGTGHSGLSAILKLGVDIIKIDKMFVDSMDDDRNSAAIIATLVELARKLGMDTVAEGVESFEQVVELRRRGIRAAQGFVFAPALPASAYLQLIESLNPPAEAAPALQAVA